MSFFKNRPLFVVMCFWLEYNFFFGFRSNPFVAASNKSNC